MKKKIGPLLATMLVAGNMIGSGLFLLPASLAAIGSSSVIGWVVSTLGALAIAGVFALLGARRPDPDGLVQWPARGVHPSAGLMSFLAYWTSGWSGNVAIGLAAVGYIVSLFPALANRAAETLLLLALSWLLVLLCMLGPRFVTRLSGMTLAIGLMPVVAATVLGLIHFDGGVFAGSWNVTDEPLLRTLPASLSIIFWAFLGLESANAAAAVVENPERNVPIAALSGVALSGGVYIVACVAVMGVIPAAELARSTAPFADVVSRLAGNWAGAFIAACAALKTIGALAGWILVTAEVGRSGAAAGYLPKFASESDPAVLPRRGLLVIGVLTTIAILATLSPTLNAQFTVILNIAVVLFMAVYALCSLALLRAPGQELWVRALAAVAFLFSLVVIVTSDLRATWPALALLALSVPLWLAIEAWRSRRAA